tara:strand:- start:369 stop:773 length:405 start_codon:yes stop_codon:yes gene_type:complete
MPIKSGKLKGELTIQELRELLNKQKIKFGKSLSRPKLIVSLEKQGITLQNNKLVRAKETGSVKASVQSAKPQTFQLTSKKAKAKKVVDAPVKVPIKLPTKPVIKLPVPIKKPVIKLPTKPIVLKPIIKLPVKKK